MTVSAIKKATNPETNDALIYNVESLNKFFIINAIMAPTKQPKNMPPHVKLFLNMTF